MNKLRFKNDPIKWLSFSLFVPISILVVFIINTKETYSIIELNTISGFGHNTLGGKGGKVYTVTTLSPDGVGSLRWAIEKNGPRTVIFTVGGVIDLSGQNLILSNPNITIKGSSAAWPGITIIRGGIIVETHDVIIENLRVRPGDNNLTTSGSWEPDGVSLVYGDAYNIWLDHLSVSWAVDENISVSGSRANAYEDVASNITISNSIIAEGLSHSIHSKGEHSKGLLVHDFAKNVAVIGNLFISNNRRNPYFKSHTTGIIANNIIYNPGSAAIDLGFVESEFLNLEQEPRAPVVNIVGNVLIHGDDTQSGLRLIKGNGKVYANDNLSYDKEAQLHDSLFLNETSNIETLAHFLYNADLVKAEFLESKMIENVGAWPWARDEIDKRIIDDFINRKSRIIDSQEQVGGYPVFE